MKHSLNILVKELLYSRGGVPSPKEQFVCEYFIPELPVVKTCYECGHRFRTELVINLYPDEFKTYGLLVISGEEVTYYELQSHECLKPVKIAEITIHRLKKQKKGGQSAPRFQRTQLQQVLEYKKSIVDLLNKNVKSKVDGIIIVGIGEIKDAIKYHDALSDSIKNKIKYVISTTTTSIQQIIPIIRPYIININKDEEKKVISKIQDMILLDPDKLLFGEKEIKEKIELKLVKSLYFNSKGESVIKDLDLSNVDEVIKLSDKIMDSWGSIIGVLRFSFVSDITI